MIRRTTLFAAALLVFACSAPAASAAEAPCELTPREQCFGLESASGGLSTEQAGAHPDLTFDFTVRQDPETTPNVFGLKNAYAATRNVRFEVPPGLIGNPNVLGVPQQCTAQELVTFTEAGGGCPNGSQIGIATITAYSLTQRFREPIYMMQPPGGDVVARLGLIAGVYPTFVNLRVRSESDYGLTAEISEATSAAQLVAAETTLWGVPSDHSHDTERCTPPEVVSSNCIISPARPPGSRELPFLTNPTRCEIPLTMSVDASSWVEADLDPEKAISAPLGTITGCDRLPFGPSLEAEPSSHHTSSPTGLDLTIKAPATIGLKVLEPSQIRDIAIDLPEGIAINPGSADGLGVCSVEQVHFKENVNAECPNNSKMATTEFEVEALSRRMKGAIYLREPEPGNLFRIWVVADDLGAHVKLPGQLEVNKETSEIRSLVLENPQVPLREVKVDFKSGFRAPLMTPHSCGTYSTHYEFTAWSGAPLAEGQTPMQITEGCETGAFGPRFQAGSTNAEAGAFSPFTFTISREDQEENVSSLNITLPQGIAASFAGIPRCEGVDAETGECPAASRIGKTVVADGAGPNPLWVPQPGKDPTAIYLSGPYKGAPFSIVAVVPAQAGPFDLGLEVVRSAVYVDPASAQATAKADPLPQIIEGIPITYKAINVQLDRPNFSLNPTSCAQKQTEANLTSPGGKSASPTASYAASDCAKLGFAPSFSARVFGPTHRGFHPRFRTVVKVPGGGANLSGVQVTLPRSEFLDQGHLSNICTRPQFKAKECPAGATIGHVTVHSPLFDFPLEGDVLLRSNPERRLPDVILTLHGPATMPIEVEAVGHVDSVGGPLRSTFEGIPDAPVSEVVVELAGGSKGLLINTEGVCAKGNRLTVNLSAQNGRRLALKPHLQADCKKKKHRKHKRHR